MRSIQTRETNRDLLRNLIRIQGENAKAKVAIGAQVGISTLEKMMAGTYGRVPKTPTRQRLCAFFGVNEAELFPEISSRRNRPRAS